MSHRKQIVRMTTLNGDFRFKTAFSLCAIACCLSGAAYGSEPAEAEPDTSAAFAEIQDVDDQTSELAMHAISLLGIRYKYGGTEPESGLDCSGLVRYLFREVHGTELPRTSREISRVGEHVDTRDLQPGDLVFYNTLRRRFSHVGVYLGDNKFIHAPSSGGEVRIESMNVSYWKKRFNGARRIGNTEQQ
jgi:cell wall-associated NlpC family hydrolase